HLEIVGDVHRALAHLSDMSLRDLPWRQRVELLSTLGRTRLATRVEVPAQERRLRGLRHSKARDREAIAHDYDVSNTFYEW
ncbi:SAM-dependent methyltransferase, partial [Saccharothrix sp. MB29]|nr:SAM-dependent methyltransferase [Saccharothrix sp. MB29]